MAKKSDGKDYPVMTLPSGKKAQIWFPTQISDLDERANEVLEGGKDLKTDHPSFNDKEYLERKKLFIDIVTSYKHGQPIPHVEYNPKEVNTWNIVFEKLNKLYSTHACKEHNSGFSLLKKECGYRKGNIPQLEDVSNFIKAQTGFQLRPVAGLLSPRDFLAGLAFRVFHCTQYVRHPDDPEYNPEPDVCHELLGHVPLLCDPTFADFCQRFGLISLGASDEDIKKLAALYWFTIEFGICKENGEEKAYGSGLLSSYGELQECLTEKTKKKQFIPEDAAMQEYDMAKQQEIYFVAENFGDAIKKMMEWTLRAIKKPFTLHYDKTTEAVKIDRIEEPVKYYSQVFYKCQSPQEWEMFFVISKDNPENKQFVKKVYSDYLKDVDQILELDENVTHLQLMKDSSPIYPWEMSEITTAEIDRDEIDHFIPESTRVPHCHFKFLWQSELSPPKLLKTKFQLLGAKGQNNMFYVVLPRDTSTDAVTIIDEHMFTLNETEANIELPVYNLRIHVPEASVTKSTKMFIRPVAAGDFKPPPDCIQVSGIYQIECSEKLEKDITLQLRHYAVVDSQKEIANFSFHSADAFLGPPYVFKEVESDSVVIDNMSATITLRQFSFLSLFGSAVLKYSCRLFYKISSEPPCHIDMHIVVTKNEHAATEFVKESYKERGYVEYANQTITFKQDKVSLKVQPENVDLVTWKMTAKVYPEIKKDEIDDFKPRVSGSIPHCCYDFRWPSNLSPTPLSVKFNLVDADDPHNYFNVYVHAAGLPHHNIREDGNFSSVQLSIFKSHLSDMLELISDPDAERLANDLSAVDLIPFSVKDNVLTTNLSRYQKASTLLNQIHRSLGARHSNKSEILVKFCDVLNRLDNPDLSRIAQDILNKLAHCDQRRLPEHHQPQRRLPEHNQPQNVVCTILVALIIAILLFWFITNYYL